MPTKIQRALISVSDKTGIVEFAQQLQKSGVEILSTGGTAKLLTESGISVIEVADYTGFPEMMDGRVKTLHPKIHGGILGRRGTDEAVMEQHSIPPIDLVVVNLYPFEQTVAKPDCDLPTAIENIDIGGPTLLRAAAKNHAAVTVVVDHADFQKVIDDMSAHQGEVKDSVRYQLAVKAFEHTARYDGAIANYLGTISEGYERQVFPQTLSLQYKQVQTMRYGENPHQQAAFYKEHNASESSIASARQLQGKELSYNNVADTDAALECVKQFDEGPACVIVKHANPCGVAYGADLLDAYNRAYNTDPESAFGGIIAFNQELDIDTAKAIIDRQFVEVIVVPSIAEDALPVFGEKKNVRVLVTGQWPEEPLKRLDFKRINGGLLVQDADLELLKETRVVTKQAPSEAQLSHLLFAWAGWRNSLNPMPLFTRKMA